MTNQSQNTPLFHLPLSFVAICLALSLLTACGGDEPSAVQPTGVADIPIATVMPPAAQEQDTAATTGCEEYFQFCNTIGISGSLTAAATTGSAGKGNDCATWAAGGDPRILELPFVVGAGESKITVALTRVGAYQGPGRYELAAATTTGLSDTFPSIEVAGRTFSNGEGSTAVVTVAVDGSGAVVATGLVELASVQVANPDPTARIDFSMAWTCQA